MKDHPLFNEDPENIDRRSRDIGYINIVKFNGTRKQTFPNQWEPETLMSVEDVYNAVGAGRFELIGRDLVKKFIVDRTMLEISDPDGNVPNAPPPNGPQNPAHQVPQQQYQPPQPAPAQQQFPPIPTAQGPGIQIPTGTDPTTALMLIFMQTQMENQKAAREDARFQASLQMTAMQTNMQTMASMVGALSGRPGAPTGADNSAESLLKGVELMSNLYAGINEGGGLGGQKQALDWGAISTNIAQSIRGIVDITKATGAAGVGAPIIPPGEPTP